MLSRRSRLRASSFPCLAAQREPEAFLSRANHPTASQSELALWPLPRPIRHSAALKERQMSSSAAGALFRNARRSAGATRAHQVSRASPRGSLPASCRVSSDDVIEIAVIIGSQQADFPPRVEPSRLKLSGRAFARSVRVMVNDDGERLDA